MELTILLVIIVSVIVGLLVNAGLLVLTTKLFKIKHPSYKRSLIVLILSGVASAFAGMIVEIVKLGALSQIVTLVVTVVVAFSVFGYLYKKYYQASWLKSLGIYVVFTIVSIVITIAFLLATRMYVTSPFVVSGESMSPAFHSGDLLLINKFDKNYSRGDVIVFRTENSFIISRVVGLPTENVLIQSGSVLINNQALTEQYTASTTTGSGALTLTQDQYFVLGDNRGDSTDSRNFGPITKSSIQGKAWYTIPSTQVQELME